MSLMFRKAVQPLSAGAGCFVVPCWRHATGLTRTTSPLFASLCHLTWPSCSAWFRSTVSRQRICRASKAAVRPVCPRAGRDFGSSQISRLLPRCLLQRLQRCAWRCTWVPNKCLMELTGDDRRLHALQVREQGSGTLSQGGPQSHSLWSRLVGFHFFSKQAKVTKGLTP